MKVYLGLGSNMGDRLLNLERAIEEIRNFGTQMRVSSVYETSAILPDHAPNEWDLPYLNLVVRGEFDLDLSTLFQKIKGIEKALGRVNTGYWSPRPIDIDILLCAGKNISTEDVTVPHPRLKERAFVLDPLKDLNPDYLHLARTHPNHSPLWMGIVNVTPDSFSDGGKWNDLARLDDTLDEWDAHFVSVIDVGAESTRPGAEAISPKVEITRLIPVLERLNARYSGKSIKPLISIDTRNVATAAFCLDQGVDVINDVSGMIDAEIPKLVKKSNAQYVLMHSLTVPSDPRFTLPENCDPVNELLKWFEVKAKELERIGLSREQIIIDPGIGFGKTKSQSISTLKNLSKLLELPYRVLVGHSRKKLTQCENEDIGVALNIISKGVDMIRLHDPIDVIHAFRSWNQLN